MIETDLLKELRNFGCECELLKKYLSEYRLFRYWCKVEKDRVILNSDNVYWEEKLSQPVFYTRCFDESLEETEWNFISSDELEWIYEKAGYRYERLENNKEVLVYGRGFF